MTQKYIKAPRGIVGDGKTIHKPIWLEINNENITYVDSKRPRGVTDDNIIELKGVTLTPGLLNLHDHISRKALQKPDNSLTFSQRSKMLMVEDSHYLLLHSVNNIKNELMNGVTYIKDFGLAGYTGVHLKRAVKEGLIAGPELKACGRPICMTGGHTYRLSHEADGVAEIRQAVRSELKNGAEFIKFMASGGLEHFPEEDPHICELSEEEMKEGIKVAHEADVMTSAHAYPAKAIINSINAGIDIIEHGVFLNDECIEKMINNNVALVPTVSGLRGVARHLKKSEQNEVLKKSLWERIFYPHEESIRKAAENGLLIGTGTDTSGTLKEEIRYLAEILEIPPIKAIAHATGIAAEIEKRNDIGLLKKGLKANIIAFEGDLLNSLAGLDNVKNIWLKGKRIL